MALDENDIAKITEIVQNSLKGNNGDGNGGNNGGGNNGGDDDSTDPAKIKAAAEAAKAKETVLKSAMAFNLGRDKFMEDNKKFIPEGVVTVFKAYATRTYANEIEQANNYRKVIMDEIFADQKNIDTMPESAKARIQTYKTLAESDKLDKAGEFFDLVDTFLTIKKGQAQAEFNNAGKGNDDEYSKKFQSLGETYTKKGV